jgi:hypothetical protein
MGGKTAVTNLSGVSGSVVSSSDSSPESTARASNVVFEANIGRTVGPLNLLIVIVVKTITSKWLFGLGFCSKQPFQLGLTLGLQELSNE